MRLKEIETRLAQIRGELTTRGGRTERRGNSGAGK